MTSTHFLFPHLSIKARVNPCVLCAATSGNLVGQVSYYNLIDLDTIQCPSCGLISVDPIPESHTVAEGCRQLYLSEASVANRPKLIRGFAKSFRRGARFAREYLTANSDIGRTPRILEIGAGDGYFSAGIKAELPDTTITLIDIVDSLVRYFRQHHDCQAIVGEFSAELFQPGSFDLIIFRDLLEHVRDPYQFLLDANHALTSTGSIFFITPNGKEDFWMINQRFTKTGGRSLLLLNHFHYFLPETLALMLDKSGFTPKQAFKFGLKHSRRGLGWKQFSEFEVQSPPRHVHATLPSVDHAWAHQPEEVRSKPLSNLGMLSRLYSMLVDTESQKVDFHDPRGHEFFVLAQRT